MLHQAVPPARSRRPVGLITGGVLLVAALLACGGGGGLLVGPAVRAGQGSDEGVVGMSVFDMHDGDDYWIYQPALDSWPDSISCALPEPSDQTYVINRSARPWSAPAQLTEDGTRFTYYGTLRGDRNEASVLLECPDMEQTYLLVPSRAPVWYFGAVVLAGVLLGVAGLVVMVLAAVRQRRRRTPARPVAAAVPQPTVPQPTVPQPTAWAPAGGWHSPAAPPAPPQVRPPVQRAGSGPQAGALRYLIVLAFILAAFLLCGAGGIAGLALGFSHTFDAPDVGSPGSGAVEKVYSTDIEYELYADRGGTIPDPHGCQLIDGDTDAAVPLVLRTRRPIGTAGTINVNGHTYRYVGSFRVVGRFSVLGDLKCDRGSSLLVRPSQRSRLVVWPAVGLATASLVAGVIVGLRIAVARRKAAATGGAGG